MQTDKPFDAVVGRFILMFLPDPTDVLRSLSRLVRADGIVAFQEISWAPFLKLIEHLPLNRACALLVHETLLRAGARTDFGLSLHRVFLEAGFRAPTMYLEMILGDDMDLCRWAYDLFQTLRPQMARNDLALEKLGDFSTLRERLHAEVLASKGVISSPGLVGAWTNV
jgi:SAM-dependent methyltransferase